MLLHPKREIARLEKHLPTGFLIRQGNIPSVLDYANAKNKGSNSFSIPTREGSST